MKPRFGHWRKYFILFCWKQKGKNWAKCKITWQTIEVDRAHQTSLFICQRNVEWPFFTKLIECSPPLHTMRQLPEKLSFSTEERVGGSYSVNIKAARIWQNSATVMALIRCALPTPFCITTLSAYRVCITARAQLSLFGKRQPITCYACTTSPNNGLLFFSAKTHECLCLA